MLSLILILVSFTITNGDYFIESDTLKCFNDFGTFVLTTDTPGLDGFTKESCKTHCEIDPACSHSVFNDQSKCTKFKYCYMVGKSSAEYTMSRKVVELNGNEYTHEFQHYTCEGSASTLTASSEETNLATCINICDQDPECKHFTYFHVIDTRPPRFYCGTFRSETCTKVGVGDTSVTTYHKIDKSNTASPVASPTKSPTKSPSASTPQTDDESNGLLIGFSIAGAFLVFYIAFRWYRSNSYVVPGNKIEL